MGGRRRQRDDAGFVRFVAAHERRLSEALISRLGEIVGREAAVEAMSYGWEHWSRVSAMDNPVGYLYVVGRDRATRHQRRRRDQPTDRPPAPSADSSVWYEPALPELVETLTDREKEVVMLLYAFEWSMSEVAELLDVSKSAVQSYASRGLDKLRTGLGVTA